MNRFSRNKYVLFGLCCVALLMFVFAGCKGDTGPIGATGATGPQGPEGPPGPGASQAANEQCLICHGPGTIAAIAAVHTLSPLSAVTAPPTINADGTIDINEQTAAQLAGLTLVGTINSVPTVTPNPVVNFTVKDSANHGIVGIPAGDLRFAIVHLTSSSTSTYWESYMVASTTSRPSTETASAITDNGDGTYSYTFVKNITTVPGVTYDGTLTHRVSIQLSGNVAGGSLNDKAVNMLYDFVPDGGTPIANQIVTMTACNSCHYKLGTTTPHGGRIDPNYCAVCHTYQRANGRTAQSPDATGTLPSGSTYIVSGQVDTAPTATAGGFAQAELITMIHKIHMGEDLKLMNESPAGVAANEVTYPQDVRNCAKCHAGTQGSRWSTNPTRKACGSCHDNVSWVSPAPTGFVLHSGGAYADDSACTLCHGSTTGSAPIVTSHIPIVLPDPTDPRLGGTNTHTNAEYIAAAGTVPPGAASISYVVSNVSVTNNHPSITFSIVSSLTGTLVFTAPTGTTSELLAGYAGSPSAYFVWAEPQDGVTTPADFNKSASVYIRNVWNGSIGASTATITDNGGGSYTIVRTGTTIPASAVMLTGGIGYTYGSGSPPLVQTTLTSYPYNATTGVGGLSVPAADVWKVATGYTGRRVIVDTAKCNACHAFLGVAPTFHVGQRNDAPTCSFCHNPNRASQGWSVNASTFVHAIHAASVRTAWFTWDATSTSGDEADEGFFNVTYPNLVNNCGACHTNGGYDFSASVYTANNGAIMANLLFSTTATGTYSSTDPNKFDFSPYVALDTNYGATGASTNLVTSPIAAACFACHDATTTMSHMRAMGATIYTPRGTAIPQ
jgi:OmcA/MtrC family decaheme c-type cytochrome